MSHTTNIIEFKKGISCGSDLVEIYCGLIAIELKLYNINPVRSHKVLDKLQNILGKNRATPGHGALSSAISELRGALNYISVDHTRGIKSLSNCDYPTIRYIRFHSDWTSNGTQPQHIKKLNQATKKVISSLKHIGYSI